ncbi:hypothetical protein TIFTF001_029049 [Ficus carica]|uniref:Uncharacterized protein n=1 Tax=Ficus carica TaxID=3494 RepID=A0AA88J2C0_FICCA|nr:hypothetical protein TIFTF001_029049 [Ficus carica]
MNGMGNRMLVIGLGGITNEGDYEVVGWWGGLRGRRWGRRLGVCRRQR